jgi:adenylate cyclase
LVKLRDADTVIELLEGVVPKVSSGWLRWMHVDTSLDPIRDDPRFKAMIAAAEARLTGSKKETESGKS